MRRRALMSIKNNLPGIVLENYLNVVALEDGLTVSLSLNDCEYRFNGIGEWKSLSAGSSTRPIKAGQTLAFRATATPVADSGIGTFTISKKCELQGTCMSMLFGDNAVENTSLATKSYAFQKLFYNCTTIVKVSDGFLPATTLSGYCYDGTFQGCTSLIQGPSLPASTIVEYSYRNLFRGCTSLTNAPVANIKNFSSGTRHCQYVFRDCTNLIDATQFVIDTTDVGEYSLYGFFNGCKSLTNPTSLNITSMGKYALAYCFDGCTSLVDVTSFQLSTTQVPDHGCYCMYRGCSSLIHVPALNAQMVLTLGMAYMFTDCTNLVAGPDVLLDSCTTFGENALLGMFQNCSSLKYIRAIFRYTNTGQTYKWVENVSSSGTFVTKADIVWYNGSSGIPSGWTRVNES